MDLKRLAKEKEARLLRIAQAGVEAAERWCENASYDEIRQFYYNADILAYEGLCPNLPSVVASELDRLRETGNCVLVPLDEEEELAFATNFSAAVQGLGEKVIGALCQ